MNGQQYSQGQLDALARHRGFHDYATWAAWNANNSARLHQPAGGNPEQAAGQQPPNFLMSLINKIPIHPSYLLNYVNGKMQSATGSGDPPQ